MTVHITWYGHATFGLKIGNHQLLIDPFFTGNPAAPIPAADAAADFILVTHGHGDHVGDTVEIATRTGAMVISNYEISDWLRSQGVEHLHAQHLGGGFNHPFGYLKLTLALHGSKLPDGSCGGNPAGFLLTLIDGRKLYFAGDTGLFGDMTLLGDEGITFAALPIGDNYTMGPEDALRAVKLLRPQHVLPFHYNTWDLIKQDPEAWAQRVEQETDAHAHVLSPGDHLDLS